MGGCVGSGILVPLLLAGRFLEGVFFWTGVFFSFVIFLRTFLEKNCNPIMAQWPEGRLVA